MIAEMFVSAKPVIHTNTKIKIQLNIMIVRGLLNSEYDTDAMQKHTFMITGVSAVPLEIVAGRHNTACHENCQEGNILLL